MTRPLPSPPMRVRQRRRSDGSWRIWWEPKKPDRALGFQPVELDADRPTWSMREAERLNADVDRARATGQRISRKRGQTIEDLIALYRADRMFTSKAPATKRGYNTQLNAIGRKWGNTRVVDFDEDVMQTWHDTLLKSSGPNYARKLIVQMSQLFKLAERKKWRPRGSNPCTGIDMETPGRRSRFATWDEYDALMTAAETCAMPQIGAAVALATLQGQRQTDILNARIEDFRQVPVPDPEHPGRTKQIWVWNLERSKRKTAGVIPLHPEVLPLVLKMIGLDRDPADHLLIDHATGRPYTVDLFEKRWQQLRSTAARTTPTLTRDTLQFRDLRRTHGVWARMGGASKEDIGDILGNSVATNWELGFTYMPPQFEGAARAMSAIQRPPKEGKERA